MALLDYLFIYFRCNSSPPFSVNLVWHVSGVSHFAEYVVMLKRGAETSSFAPLLC